MLHTGEGDRSLSAHFVQVKGTVRERMCLCMYATDPAEAMFSSGPALDLLAGFTVGRIGTAEPLRIRFCFPVRSNSPLPEVNRTGLPFSANGQKECVATRLRPLLSASLFLLRSCFGLTAGFTAGRIEQQSSPHPVLFSGP